MLLARRTPLADSPLMLHTVQPWLPLLAPEPPVEEAHNAPARKARRKIAARTRSDTDAVERHASRQAYLGLVARWSLSGLEALTPPGKPSSGEAEREERLHALLGAHCSSLLIAPEPAAAPPSCASPSRP